jgi:isopenicillin N synthase-like dioxygenase
MAMENDDYSLHELRLESTLGGEGSDTDRRTIPVIDMSSFRERKALIAEELWDAATTTGFFQLSNHGINTEDIEEAFEFSKRFFALSEQIKSDLPLKGGGKNAGWESKAQIRPSTRKADQKESYQITRPNMEGVWPSESDFPEFKSTLLKYENQCWELGMKVLSCFALKLGFDETFFTQVHNPESSEYQSTLRLLHYYPIERSDMSDGEWRAGAHTDFDCLTLLFQKDGQDGLQVCPGLEAESGEWTSVRAKTDLVTCNIGDMLMRWSDDELKSTLHRVRFPKNEEGLGSRYSLAFFCQADKSAIIQGPKKRYEAISAENYLKERIAANFTY